MKLFSISEFTEKALGAFKRFPFTLIWAILSSGIVIYILEKGAPFFESKGNLILTMVLGISWLIGAQFYIEQFKKKHLWWIKLIVILALVAFYFTLPEYNVEDRSTDTQPYIRYALYLITGHLTLFFAPFITVWHPKAYWNYIKNMIIAIGRSALFSGVLYVGLVVALLAMQSLFKIEIEDKRYGQLFVLCLSVVNTWVYLADFPKNIQHNIHLTFFKAVEVFVKFILIPLALLYMVILYAYGVKIIVEWELPEGWVSYLVTALAALLLSIQFIVHPVRLTHESRWIKKFHPLFFWLLLPLLLLLYVAIYRRVSEYGITEARYFLILVAFFITVSSCYLIFSRKQQLRFLPIGLAVLAIAGSFGFWGAFSVSTRSQLRQFEEVYTAFAKMDSTTISQENKHRLISISSYLHRRKSIAEVTPILGYNPEEQFPDSRSWNIGEKILDSLGYKTSEYMIDSDYFSYNAIREKAISIGEYETLSQFYFDGTYNASANKIGDYSFNIGDDGKSIVIKNQSENVKIIALDRFLNELPKRGVNDVNFAPEKLSIEDSIPDMKFKIIFNNLYINKKNASFEILSGNAFILSKTKQ